MFLVPHILMFTIIYIAQISSLGLRDANKTDDALLKKITGILLKTKDVSQENITIFTRNPLFQTKPYLTSTRASNLKSNVFDKMLSDEMLLIKKSINEDIYPSSVTTATTRFKNAPTSNLERKAIRPVTNFQLELNHVEPLIKTEEYDEERSGNNDDLNVESGQKKANEKVLGLRSLPEATPHSPHQCTSFHRGSEICTCMGKHHSTTSSHRSSIKGSKSCCDTSNKCTRHSTSVTCSKTCSHTPSQCTSHSYSTICTKTCSHTPSQSTSSMKVFSYLPVYYAPFQPYFVGKTTQLPYVNTYYHPDVVNELKLPRKTKRRKPTAVCTDKNLYYDNDDVEDVSKIEEEKNYDGDSDYEEEVRKPEVTSDMKIQLNENDDGMDLSRDHLKYEKNKLKGNNVINSQQVKLVQDLYDDLKFYYSDSVVKDCYCGSFPSSSSYPVINGMIYFQSMVLIFIAH